MFLKCILFLPIVYLFDIKYGKNSNTVQLSVKLTIF